MGENRSHVKLLGVVAVAGAMVTALAVPALGSASTTRSPASSKRAVVHFKGSPIHFTVLGPDTGGYATIGQSMYQGAADGASAVNAAGGILGRKLILDKVDTHGDPADAVSTLQQELARNHPSAIIGPVTLEIFGVRPVITQNKIPTMFNGGSTAFDHNTDPWIWRSNPSDSQEATAIAMYARQKGIKRAAILFTTEASQQELEPFLVKDFKALGGTVVSETNVSPTQSSYSSAIIKLLGTHPQAIIGQLDAPTAATFFHELIGLNGTKTPFIGTDLTAGGDWITAVEAKNAKAMVSSVEGATPTNPAGNEFNKLQQAIWHQPAPGGANYAYDGVIDAALAIDAVKGTTGLDINRGLPLVSNPPGRKVYTYSAGLAALKAGKKINYDGASGPMDYNKYHNVSGPWIVVKSTGNANGSLDTIKTITAAQVAAVSKKIGA